MGKKPRRKLCLRTDRAHSATVASPVPPTGMEPYCITPVDDTRELDVAYVRSAKTPYTKDVRHLRIQSVTMNTMYGPYVTEIKQLSGAYVDVHPVTGELTDACARMEVWEIRLVDGRDGSILRMRMSAINAKLFVHCKWTILHADHMVRPERVMSRDSRNYRTMDMLRPERCEPSFKEEYGVREIMERLDSLLPVAESNRALQLFGEAFQKCLISRHNRFEKIKNRIHGRTGSYK